MSHKMLRKVHLHHRNHFSNVTLNCPSLEELDLVKTDMVENCLELLNSTCPKVKSLKVDMAMFEGESFNVYHETVEELMMLNHYEDGVCLTLPCLRVLRLSCGAMALPRLGTCCPNLKELCVSECDDLGKLPSLLDLFPVLESLSISHSCPFRLQVDLMHPHVQKVLIACMDKGQHIVLSMPNLEELYIFKSCITELTLASNKSVTLEPTCYGRSSRGGRKMVSRGGESLTLGIDYMQNMLGVVHGRDTLWMEENKKEE